MSLSAAVKYVLRPKLFFKATINTALAGTSASNQFTLPINTSDTAPFLVDWGDGLTENISATTTHTYPASGIYTINFFNLVPSFFFNNGGDKAKLINLVSNNKSKPRINMLDAFLTGCSSLANFPFIDTSAVTTLSNRSWSGCTSLTSFPLLDTSSVTNFTNTWNFCTSITSFPRFNTRNAVTFGAAWAFCYSITNFPLLDTTALAFCTNAWTGCSSLVNFPANMFDNSNCTSFLGAWDSCALNQTSVDGILVSINSRSLSNGTLGISGGTNATPSATGQAAATALRARGWTVTLNGF